MIMGSASNFRFIIFVPLMNQALTSECFGEIFDLTIETGILPMQDPISELTT
jgi:hypothetical protein